MKTETALFLADQWAEDQYTLLDSGDGHKLERFGSQTVIRPDPQAFWSPASPVESWIANARFAAQAGDDDRGTWPLPNGLAPEACPMAWRARPSDPAAATCTRHGPSSGDQRYRCGGHGRGRDI